MLIDVHSHVSPAAYPPAPHAEVAPRWPCMRCEQARQVLHIGERPFRPLDARSWNVSSRLSDMDRDGVDVQVLSPMPELLSYWLDVPAAQLLCDHSNELIAEMIATAPSRFRGLGAVCLQQPEDAPAQLSRLKTIFGLSGVEIGSNINGVMLDDARFEPFFAAAEALDLAVFVHALHPVAVKPISSSPVFTAFAGFPIDVAMAIAAVTMAGIMDRYPRLRLGFSHGGGAVGAMLGRLDKGWEHSDGFGGAAVTKPSAQAARLFYDSNVYDPAYLKHLCQVMAPGRVFLGTDYPYPIMQQLPSAYIASVGLNADAELSLHQGAAADFLNEPDWRG